MDMITDLDPLSKLPSELITFIVTRLLDLASIFSLGHVSKYYAQNKIFIPFLKEEKVYIYVTAIQNKYSVKFFEWILFTSIVPECHVELLCIEAAKVGSLEILKLVYKRLELSEDDEDRRYYEDDYWRYYENDYLRFIKENENIYYPAIMSAAIENGNFDCVQWLDENDCPWNKDSCDFAAAAAGGHIEILEWLHENECPWDEYACDAAEENGHSDIVEWFHKVWLRKDTYPCFTDKCSYCKNKSQQ